MAEPAHPTLTLTLAEPPVGTPVGVAVSGGGDSMALLGLARDWAAAHSVDVAVATVDHGLRSESASEAAFVADICTEWGIQHQTLTLSGLADGTGNLPARARTARYDALSSWAVEAGIRTVLLGHTMDDQAETVLMRLARGSGAEGLSGMAVQMDWGAVRFQRPLLHARREALRAWLRAKDLRWIDDPTNDDTRFDRVKAREALRALEPMGITVEGLSATAERLSRQRAVLEEAADAFALQAITQGENGVTLDRNAFRTALPDTAMRVLAWTLMQVGGGAYRPRFRALEPLYQRIVSEETTAATLAGCLIHLKADKVRITRERS